jgi:hypothetical protein
MRVNWSRHGKRRLWFDLRPIPDICFKELRKITMSLTQKCRLLGQDLKLGTPEYEREVLHT